MKKDRSFLVKVNDLELKKIKELCDYYGFNRSQIILFLINREYRVLIQKNGEK